MNITLRRTPNGLYVAFVDGALIGLVAHSSDGTTWRGFYQGEHRTSARTRKQAAELLAEYAERHQCRQCGADLGDGEGYDGLCGNCADKEDTK